MDDNDGQMIFGDLGGLKLPEIRFTGEENPRKNLSQETCPDRGSNRGPLRDRRACYHLAHSGGPASYSSGCCSETYRNIGPICNDSAGNHHRVIILLKNQQVGHIFCSEETFIRKHFQKLSDCLDFHGVPNVCLDMGVVQSFLYEIHCRFTCFYQQLDFSIH